MKNLKILIVGLFLLFIHSGDLLGQGWEKYTPIPTNSTWTGMPMVDFTGDVTVAKTINGEYAIVPTLNTSDQFMLIDTNGNYSWNTFDTLPFQTDVHLVATNDNHYISVAEANTSFAPDLYLAKLDSIGDTLWTKNYYGMSTISDFHVIELMQTQDNNILLLSNDSNFNLDDFRLIKLDYNTGNILWDKTISYNSVTDSAGSSVLYDNLVELPNGDIAFSVAHRLSSNDHELFIVKTDNDGNFITSKAYSYPNSPILVYTYLDVNSSGEFALVAVQFSGGNPLLIKIDNQLNETWRQTIWTNGNVKDVLLNDDGSVMIAGEQNDHRTIKKYDASGNTLWTRQHSHYNTQTISTSIYHHIEPLSNGDYMLFGTTAYSVHQPQIYVAKVDSNGYIHYQLIEGNIYNDANLDCAYNNGENTLQSNVFLQVTAGTDTNYVITDDNGYYNYPTSAGTYELSALPIGANWLSCPPQTVTLNTKDTISQDLGLRPISTCHDLKVSITTPTLVRCFSNTYTVSYQNLGTQTETGVYIEIELDNFLIVNSASIPYTQNGNIYTFFIGNLNIAETGGFIINTTVDCNAVLGQAHCVDATIFPNQICVLNSTTWNGATIITNAFCSPNDSVTFELINIGLGNMTQPRNYYVIEDQVLPYQGTYQLQQGQDTSFTFPANGYVYQIQADQEITHPWGNNMPSAITYGCNNGNLITNALNQLSLNDNLNFQDVDCQQNVGSFDPNDKTGFPFGYGSQHYITKNDKIEYLIRFQNTGTYTAFNVRVADEIDITKLDLTTLQIQGSSHNYELEIENGHTLVFKFNNIMLPDSNTNEAASHGFIRFKIAQKSNNAIGTVIENSAAIYFDFNAPVITNTTFHTVGENFIQVVSTKPIQEKLATVKVFPNPFSEQATFEIETDERYENLTLTVYNIMGQTVKSIQSNGDNRMILDRNGLGSGIYFYQIRSEGLVLDSGKLMVQ
jgi:hypothetical protein